MKELKKWVKLSLNQIKGYSNLILCNSKFLNLEERYNKLSSDTRYYQNKYKFTAEDIAKHENHIGQIEYQLEETMNQLQMLKSQNYELNNLNNTYKIENERLIEQKRSLEKEITRLEQVISELQLNLTNSQQQQKKEVSWWIFIIFFRFIY